MPELFEHDSDGTSPLFKAAASGDMDAVRKLIFSLAGTGVCCQRLALIEKKDPSGMRAADVAEKNGHQDIADLLRGEQMRMEFYE